MTVHWGDSVVATRRLGEGGNAVVGAAADTMSPLPCETLGVAAVTVAAVRRGAPIALVPRGAVGFRERPRQLPSPVAGPSEITVAVGETVSFSIGGFLITVTADEDARAPWAAPAPLRTSLSPMRYVAIAGLAHAALIGLSAQAAYAQGFEESGPDTEALQRYLAAADERSSTPDELQSADGEANLGVDVNGKDGNGKDGGGARAAGPEGSMGAANSRSKAAARFAVSGRNDDSASVAATPDDVLEQARSFGMVSLLQDRAHAPIETFGFGAASVDPFAANGAMWAVDVGETHGAGGIGLHGIGEGGGGTAAGSIGLGEIGTLGHTFGRPGLGTGGAGLLPEGGGFWGSGVYSCGDFGGVGLGSIGTIGHGAGFRDRGPSHLARPAKTEEEGEARLPAETVRRIVRQSSGRFRACYQSALLANPALAGGVTTTFLIGADGRVASAANTSADLPDKHVVSCVTSVFSSLVFPEPPDGRLVTVTYPLTFSPAQ